MSEELDLTKSVWNRDEDLYLNTVRQSVEENYPGVNLEEELRLLGYSWDNLLQTHKLNRLINTLNKKYPSDDI